MDGAPGRIRTADHLVRSQVLYPAELRARGKRILAAKLRVERAQCAAAASGAAPARCVVLFLSRNTSGTMNR